MASPSAADLFAPLSGQATAAAPSAPAPAPTGGSAADLFAPLAAKSQAPAPAAQAPAAPEAAPTPYTPAAVPPPYTLPDPATPTAPKPDPWASQLGQLVTGIATQAPAFAIGAAKGVAALPQGITNLNNRLVESLPEPLRMAYPGSGLNQATQLMNQALGRPANAPIDVTGMMTLPMLEKQAPIASGAGELLGGGFAPGVAELAAAAKLASPAGRLALQHGLGGGLYGLVSEGGEQAKEGTFDPARLAAATGVGGALGAGGGAIAGKAAEAAQTLGQWLRMRGPQLPTPAQLTWAERKAVMAKNAEGARMAGQANILREQHRRALETQVSKPIRGLIEMKRTLVTPGPTEQAHLSALEGQQPYTPVTPARKLLPVHVPRPLVTPGPRAQAHMHALTGEIRRTEAVLAEAIDADRIAAGEEPLFAEQPAAEPPSRLDRTRANREKQTIEAEYAKERGSYEQGVARYKIAMRKAEQAKHDPMTHLQDAMIAHLDDLAGLPQRLEEEGVVGFFEALVHESKKQAMADPFGIGAMAVVAKAARRTLASRGIHIDPAKVFAGAIAQLKRIGMPSLRKQAGNVSFFRRIALSQVTSDIIRLSNQAFARKRDQYLAERERAGALKLPGHEARQADTDRRYTRLLKAEMARLETQGLKGSGIGSLFGQERYLRMLRHDLEDLEGRASKGFFDPVLDAVERMGTHLQTGIFMGNYPVSSLHIFEYFLTWLSRDPGAMVHSMRLLGRSAKARQFAAALAGPGMQERILADGKRFPWSKFGDAIDEAIKKGIGKPAYDVVSAQTPEYAKTAATTLGAAVRVAGKHKYPGGVQAFIDDYMASAAGQHLPPQRAQVFEDAAVDFLVERNETSMYLPEGPLKERTVVQRRPGGSTIAAFTRPMIQNSRVLTGYLDEIINAKTKPGQAKALVKATVLAAMMTGLAGTKVMPDIVWDAWAKIDKKGAERAKQIANEARQHNVLGGREIHHLGLRHPLTDSGRIVVAESLERVLKEPSAQSAMQDPGARKEVAVVATALVMSGLLDRLGGVGLMRAASEYGRVMDFKRGHEQFKVYTEPKTILEHLTGKHGKQLGAKQGKRLKYTAWDVLADLFIHGERAQKADHRNRLETIEDRKQHAH